MVSLCAASSLCRVCPPAVAHEKSAKDHAKGLASSHREALETYYTWAASRSDEGLTAVLQSLVLLEREWEKSQGRHARALKAKKEASSLILASERRITELQKAVDKARRQELQASREAAKALGRTPQQQERADAKLRQATQQRDGAEATHQSAVIAGARTNRSALRATWLEYYQHVARMHEEGALVARHCAEIVATLPDSVDDGYDDHLRELNEHIFNNTLTLLHKIQALPINAPPPPYEFLPNLLLHLKARSDTERERESVCVCVRVQEREFLK
ncbi:uncharacterized protein MONBRDRAFT_26122 [Monosiga brevicollis MX1]|uniref:Uncharacterized protein n=1 Tax=Monosiga brevicollis TaxID=81824 RepID=A9V1F2_MONBE|nr:uncharacterized protein MONBRDRAFT_26122 [Monosiga brevicollis MX1]EDQ88557.1 predicted protein [Monosiga brevicollis MX1]|eukprot:XP_001746661.1 hypothetical protein [Monosiga brevicollis MX1]